MCFFLLLSSSPSSIDHTGRRELSIPIRISMLGVASCNSRTIQTWRKVLLNDWRISFWFWCRNIDPKQRLSEPFILKKIPEFPSGDWLFGSWCWQRRVCVSNFPETGQTSPCQFSRWYSTWIFHQLKEFRICIENFVYCWLKPVRMQCRAGL